MKKTLLLILLTPLLCGCPGDDLDIIANERLYTEGVVRLENGSPVSNIDVSISENTGILGESTTDASGGFSFVSLKSSDPTMQLSVNKTTDSLLSRLTYIAFDTSAQDYSIDEAILQPTSYVSVMLTKITPNADNLYYSFEFKETFCERLLTGINESSEQLSCYETTTISDELGSDGLNTVDFSFRTLQNDPVIFRYKIGEEGQETMVEIPLNNSTTTYEFEY